MRRLVGVLALSVVLVLGLPSVAGALVGSVGSSGQLLADTPAVSAEEALPALGESDLPLFAGDALEDCEALGVDCFTWAGLIVIVAGLVGTCYVAGDCTSLGGPGTISAAQQTMEYVQNECQGQIEGNEGFPPWTADDFGTAASPAEWVILGPSGAPIGFPDGWQYDDGSGLFCDYMSVFPELYSPTEITQEPWQWRFCTEVETWDGGGYWPPVSTSAATGTSWAWATAPQLAWINAACPPSWIATLDTVYPGDVAGAGPAPGTPGAQWTMSNSDCVGVYHDYDLPEGSSPDYDGLVADFQCSGPSWTPGSTDPMFGAASTAALYFRTAPSTDWAVFTGGGHGSWTCAEGGATAPGIGDYYGTVVAAYTVPANVEPGSGNWTLNVGCSTEGVRPVALGSLAFLEGTGSYDAQPAVSALAAVTFTGSPAAAWPVLSTSSPVGTVTTIPGAPAAAPTTPTTVVPATGSSATNLGDIASDLSNGWASIASGVTWLGSTLLQPLDALESLVSGLGNLLTSLFVPTESPVTMVQSQVSGTPAYTWVAGSEAALVSLVGTASSSTSGSDCGPYIGFGSIAGLAGSGGHNAFGIQMPSWDSACPGNGTGGAYTTDDGQVGNLYGFRSTLRTLILLVITIGFIVRVSRSLPWSASSDDPAPDL